MSVDLACASAHWEDENAQYKKSKTKASDEAFQIGNVLDNYKKRLHEK